MVDAASNGGSPRIVLPSAPDDQRDILEAGGVAVWREPIDIGTYEPAAPTRFPMFLDRRVYQGSSGRVYPLPFIERIGRERQSRTWDAIHLENEFVRLVLLPELGGRIHVGYDKTTGYDFFYRNNVIKPALVGLAGPWISGGVEFNWPQHHRPATYLPVDTRIERRGDGSVVVWHSDHEPFQRMKGMHGVLLRPASTLIELQVRLHNRTEEPQTFLWWANVAARSSDSYQSFFPTDVSFVADHARRAVSAFPRADRPYYGVDYPSRVTPENPDADRLDFYRNIPVPTSYMVLETRDDFFGGYDHDADAGFVHWADRRIAPGKKQWTWGNAPFGHAWDRLLTDGDGPYVELMAGVFTDNQPDFSYLAPDEVRNFSQYWFPISRIGVVHQATRDAALSVTVPAEGEVRIGVAVTRERRAVRLELAARNGACATVSLGDVSPAVPYVDTTRLEGAAAAEEVTVRVIAGDELLVCWEAATLHIAEPAVATAPPPPVEVPSADELYLIGVHLLQYRHPTRSPEPYFQQIVDRDPGDVRANVALSAVRYREARFDDAERHARTALARLTQRNPNPADGEASYRLGLALVRQEKWEEAIDAFTKAAWDKKWANPARLESALVRARLGRDQEALDELEARRERDGRGNCLMVTLLRRVGSDTAADALLAEILTNDPLDQWALALAGDDSSVTGLAAIDVAVEAEAAGDRELAHRMLDHAAASAASSAGNAAPIALYLNGLLYERESNVDAAARARAEARIIDDALCFPAGLAAERALREALVSEPDDPRARSLLATWLYSVGRKHEALEHWKRVIESGTPGAVTLRNAAVASANLLDDSAIAYDFYTRAIELEPRESRLWLERDTLAERAGATAEERWQALSGRPSDALERDDLVAVEAELLCELGQFDRAHALLARQELQPWEGGEGRVIAAWEHACLGLARRALDVDDALAAVRWADCAMNTPASLGEARHLLAGVADILVVRGDALLALGREADARVAWEAALADASALTPDRAAVPRTFWVGVAALRLGAGERAAEVWSALDAAAEAIEADAGVADYFATSLPSTLLFDSSPEVVRREADRLRALAEAGRALA